MTTHRARRLGAPLASLYGTLIFAAVSLPSPSMAAPTSTELKFAACNIGDLPSDAECGEIEVLEDRSKPTGRKLKLPVLRLPSPAGHKADPMFVLNGGPGAPNLGTIRPMDVLQHDRDIYYVGYRGADGAGALTCPEVAPVAEMPNLLSATTLDALSSAMRACSDRLQKSGVDLSHYSMFDVIDDLEEVRASLGHAKVNLFSTSYGTRIAQYYARQHPGVVSHSVMFGANPPGHFVFSAYVNDKTLDRLAVLCAADPACASRTSDLGRTLRSALSAGERSGNPAINDGKTQYLLIEALHSRETTGLFIDAALAAEAGNLEPLAGAGGMVGDMLTSIIWGDLLAKGEFDSYRYAGLQPTFARSDRSMGSPLDAFFSAAFKYWPHSESPTEYRRAAVDMTPTLIFNGDIDIATPLIFAEAELMPYLPNGRLVVFKDYGHHDYGRQAKGIGPMVAEYLRTGRVDTSGLVEDPYTFGK